ncbi:MAG TPA: flagellar hook-length control protein FliK, partial [Acetobacteraceae bacterium]|nr:flagellar hook-length control protein FliK [Acetobacteraceae bacterium]
VAIPERSAPDPAAPAPPPTGAPAAPAVAAALPPGPAPLSAPPRAAAAAPAAPAAPVAQQVATAVARLSVRAGEMRLDLALHPETLGRVTIRIERSGDGSTAVHIAVERPEALAALHREAPQLQAALDRAGLAAGQRSVTVALAPPASGASQNFAAGDQPRERNRPRQAPRPRPRAAATGAFPAVNITA